MTEKLFYENAYLKTMTAQVRSCEPAENGFWVKLDRTAFYPEGGGQPGDTGTLNGVRVLDTQEREDEILHLCESALEVGAQVQGTIDWARRFTFMQQHSGEHILSGLINAAFGYHNVGFHMGADSVTVDVSGLMTAEQAAQIERKANELVWQNVAVREMYPSEEQLRTIDFRSKKELHGWVRLVEIPGADLCACCGMHVARTGEIGLIKILSVQKFHEGVRLEMLCGEKAYDYVNLHVAQNRKVGALVSAPAELTAEHVQRLLEEKAALQYRLTGLQNEWIRMLAQQAAAQELPVAFTQDLDSEGVRKLCTAMMEHTQGVCAAFTGSDEAGYQYAVARLQPEEVKQMNAALSGRGGGKPGFAQGSLKAGEAIIRAWFEAREKERKI